MIDELKISGEVVELGAAVKISQLGEKYEVAIVGKYDIDPDRYFISEKAKLAEALLGHRVGDVFTYIPPDGEPHQIEVLAIRKCTL